SDRGPGLAVCAAGRALRGAYPRAAAGGRRGRGVPGDRADAQADDPLLRAGVLAADRAHGQPGGARPVQRDRGPVSRGRGPRRLAPARSSLPVELYHGDELAVPGTRQPQPRSCSWRSGCSTSATSMSTDTFGFYTPKSVRDHENRADAAGFGVVQPPTARSP